ncbi:MAG: hypothetical protein HKN03_13950 [Acidimicrobiales bacterium]|nr:hypothetical protein [Acidimicrobiales bacterium]
MSVRLASSDTVDATSLSMASEVTGPVSPSEAVWKLIDHPFRPIDAARAIFGLTPAAARHVVGRELLNSDEALRLLDETPDMIRYLRNQLSYRNIRSVGAVLGPIQWQATITARAAAGFPEDLFICAAPYRDFDLPENRVLAYALKRLVDAGRHVNLLDRESFDDERVTEARARARQALSYLEHRSLIGVKPKNDPGTIRKLERSTDLTTYQTVLDFLPRATRPLSQRAINHLSDRRTALQHKVLLAVLATLMREGVNVRPLQPLNGVLVGGPVEYRHPGSRGLAGAHGIRIGEILIDVPDVHGDPTGSIRRLGSRSGRLTPFIVESVEHVNSLSHRLLESARAEP